MLIPLLLQSAEESPRADGRLFGERTGERVEEWRRGGGAKKRREGGRTTHDPRLQLYEVDLTKTLLGSGVIHLPFRCPENKLECG